jgi:hypothetical protein
MGEYILTQIELIMKAARETYGVDPIIFLVIYTICGPFFYYSLFKTVAALAKKLFKEAILWSTILLFATIAPFIYVLFFGRNIPWWVYGVISIIFIQTIYSIVMRIKRVPVSGVVAE